MNIMSDMINHISQFLCDFHFHDHVTLILGDVIDHTTLKLFDIVDHDTLEAE